MLKKKYQKLSDFPKEVQAKARAWAEKQHEKNNLRYATYGSRIGYALRPLPKKPKPDPDKVKPIEVGRKHIVRTNRLPLEELIETLRDLEHELRAEGATELMFDFYSKNLVGYKKPTVQELEDEFQQKYDGALQHRANVYAARELYDKITKEAAQYGGPEEKLKDAIKINPDWIVEKVFRQYRMGKL